MKTTLLRFSFIALAFLFSACSDDDGPATQNGGNGNGELYLRLNMDGNSEIDVTGSIGEFDESPILASLTTEANGGLDPNTVQVSGGIINEEGTGHTKIMSIVLKDITAPGTYDLVAQDGMFNYSVGDSNGSPIAGYYIGASEDGSFSVTIIEISSQVRPGIGKPIKGSFTATYIDKISGTETVFEGEFNGGVE